MPHFTVVPVDGPRRGDYDNLEGLSWVDYGERADREDADGEGRPGGVPGRGGERAMRDRLAHRRRAVRTHVDEGPTFLKTPSPLNSPQLLALRHNFPGPPAPAVAKSTPPPAHDSCHKQKDRRLV